MFGLGPVEMIIILVILVMLFGVGKLPEIGGAIGKGIRNFKKSSKEGEEETEAKKLEEKK